MSTPSTPPPTPSPDTAAAAALSLNDSDWDWLDDVPITPVVEELNRFANTLFAEAQDSKIAEAQEKGLVGSTTTSLEPGWPCLEDITDELTLTNAEASVTYPIMGEKKPFLLKLDLTPTQTLNGQNCETPDVFLENAQNHSSGMSSCTNTSTQSTSESIENSNQSVSIDANECCMEEETCVFSGDSMDCVEKEEVVETSEFLDLPLEAPTIVLTEAVDLIEGEEDISELSSSFLTPGDIMEDCNSDHGYESYGSPISEPDQLVSLFPELW